MAAKIEVRTQKKRGSALLPLFCWLPLVCVSVAQSVPQMPKIQGESFAGHTVVLPDAAAGKVAVLIFGFTKASKAPTSAWADKLQSFLETRPEVELYQLPVLEDVPGLFRSMVISGIRKGVPENKRDHFVPVVQGEADLKKLVGYKEKDDAYLIILGRAGNIVQQIHGTPNDANTAQLKSTIESLLKQK